MVRLMKRFILCYFGFHDYGKWKQASFNSPNHPSKKWDWVYRTCKHCGNEQWDLV